MATKKQQPDASVQYTLTEDFGDFKKGDTVSADELGDQLDAAIEAGALAPADADTPPAKAQATPEPATQAAQATRQERTSTDKKTGTITVEIA